MKHSTILSFVAAFASASAFADATADATADAAATAVDLAEAVPEATSGWETKISAGLETYSGNTDKDGVNGRIETQKSDGDTVVIASLEGAWEQQEKTCVREDGSTYEDDERTVGNAKFDVNVKERFGGFFVYGNASGKHDGMSDLKYRFVESVGLGTYLVDEDALKFSAEGGYAYVQEKIGSEKDDYPALRLAERIDWKPSWAEGVSFYETVSALWDLDDTDHWLVGAEAGADVPLAGSFSLVLKAAVDYDSDPGEGVKKTDRKLLLQLAYSF